MAKRIDELPEYRAKLPRTSHVLSHDLDMTATCGHLNPVFHTILNPFEKISLGFDFNIRTMPLSAAAFADLTTHVEYFFVPMQLLYQPFENVIYNIDNQFSSMFDADSQSNLLPVVNFQELFGELFDNRSQIALSGGESVGQSSIRLFDLLGFNPRGIANVDQAGGRFYNPNVFPYQLLAYNCIYQYYYRLDNRESFDSSSFNLDKFYNSQAPVSLPYYYALMHLRPFVSDYFTDVKPSPIVDMLNLNTGALAAAQDWLSGNTNITPVAGSSVQQYTTFSQDIGGSVGIPVYSANTKSTVRTTQAGLQGTHVLASTGVTPGSNPLEVSTANFATRLTAQVETPHTHLFNSGGAALSTANIRALFATEKLWSITGRAKKNYDDQTLAHFGFKVPHDVKHQISCFGHDVNKIHIGEVIATAATQDASLGEIAGKGYGAQSGRKHTFVAPCHGVVMAIFSVVPTRNYETGFAKYNVLTAKEDLYLPEYDSLGMQPMFDYETNPDLANDDSSATQIIGWQYRYEQWKRRYNRVTGAFVNSEGSLADWALSYRSKTYQPTMYADSFTAFVYKPADLNQIMLAQYQDTWSQAFEGEWSAIYDLDPFVVNGHVNAVLVSSMSDYSLPRLDA